jgi:ATP synthase protein I
LAATIGKAAQRRKKARAERRAGLWAQVARVGTLGWMVALPIVGGALLGHFLDRWLHTGIAFSLALLFAGIAAGGYGLWQEIKKGMD